MFPGSDLTLYDLDSRPQHNHKVGMTKPQLCMSGWCRLDKLALVIIIEITPRTPAVPSSLLLPTPTLHFLGSNPTIIAILSRSVYIVLAAVDGFPPFDAEPIERCEVEVAVHCVDDCFCGVVGAFCVSR